MGNSRYGAVILAAGYSSRMGTFKPTLKIGDETVVVRLQRVFKENGVDDVTVVGGHGIEALKEEILEGSRLVFNEKYDQGMFTSIQKGLESHIGNEGVFLTPVDCPLISSEVVDTMIRKMKGDCFAIPLYLGKKGHPLYIPQCHIEEILKHDGSNGLKGITDKYRKEFQRIETGDIGCVLDMDTPADYEKIKRFQGKRFDGPSEIRKEAEGRTFYLIRHGETVQHERGKIFLGQTDVHLSDRGRRQAEELKESIEIRPERIYVSPLSRAKETAHIVFPDAEHIIEEGFKEMNLGPWDGKYIKDIKREEPGLFEERGKDIFAFKLGNRGENFYDLQYRVMMSLLDILKKDKSREVVIVSHSGVMRCIENLLDGRLVDSEWKRPENGEVRIVRK